jgi:hypothetical protein
LQVLYLLKLPDAMSINVSSTGLEDSRRQCR